MLISLRTATGRDHSAKKFTLQKDIQTDSDSDKRSTRGMKESVDKLTRDIEDSYKQLVANLDKQKEGDPTVAQLKDSITKKYAEFDKLKNRRAMEEVVEKQWTEGEYLS